MATSFPVLTLGLKMPNKDTFARQTLGTTDLKLGMHTKLDFGGNMGWFLTGYTSSYLCV